MPMGVAVEAPSLTGTHAGRTTLMMTPNQLYHLAVYLRDTPFFLASHPALHAEDTVLCERLGCDVGTLTKLRLCKMPRDEEDVRRIAERVGVEARRLAGILG
jgi:hypothetical protein